MLPEQWEDSSGWPSHQCWCAPKPDMSTMAAMAVKAGAPVMSKLWSCGTLARADSALDGTAEQNPDDRAAHLRNLLVASGVPLKTVDVIVQEMMQKPASSAANESLSAATALGATSHARAPMQELAPALDNAETVPATDSQIRVAGDVATPSRAASAPVEISPVKLELTPNVAARIRVLQLALERRKAMKNNNMMHKQILMSCNSNCDQL